jgi:hypothetical protein
MGKRPGGPDLTLVSSALNGPQPPRKLNKHGNSLWNAILRDFVIDDTAGLEILAQICAAADRAERLAATVAKDGETIRTRSGLKLHPAIAEERAARSFICRQLVKLGVVTEAVKPVGRPSGGFGWRGNDADE